MNATHSSMPPAPPKVEPKQSARQQMHESIAKLDKRLIEMAVGATDEEENSMWMQHSRWRASINAITTRTVKHVEIIRRRANRIKK